MTEYRCRDCAHSFRPISMIFLFGWNSKHTYLCRKSYRPETEKFDPVIGSVKEPARYEHCTIARIGVRDDRCGEAARWWQPRAKQGLFKLIIKDSQP